MHFRNSNRVNVELQELPEWGVEEGGRGAVILSTNMGTCCLTCFWGVGDLLCISLLIVVGVSCVSVLEVWDRWVWVRWVWSPGPWMFYFTIILLVTWEHAV